MLHLTDTPAVGQALAADLPALEGRLAAGLRRRSPRGFRRRPIPVAIDTHSRPFCY